jgi:hypothetical protein
MELYTVTDGNNHEITFRDFTTHGVTIPSGFRSDGASAPRPFWWVIPPFKGTKKAAFIHDYLCSIAKDKYERRAADCLFYIILIHCGLSKVRASIGYLGVRIGALMGIGVHYSHWATPIWKFIRELKALNWLFSERL